MKPALIGVCMALGLAAGTARAGDIPPYVSSAMADPARAADVANDARRHGADLVAYSGAKPGARIIELEPGGGYFTRIFSKVVGPDGKIYAVWPTEYDKEAGSESSDMRAMAKKPGYGNIEVVIQPAAALKVPEPVDLVFTSQNYHDYPDPFMGPVDMASFNRQVFDALKPGGVFLIVDHVADAGSGLRDTNTRHRIDPEIVKAQVTKAGFTYAGELAVLRNPADDHQANVFDKSIRGHTDQFVYKFVKPAA